MEKVAVLLLSDWSASFCRGMIVSVNKADLKLNSNTRTRLKSFSHVQFYGYINKDFIVLDFIEDFDNISTHEIELVKMMEPTLEIKYERDF